MIKAARVRVAVWKQQPPPVLRRLVHELVYLFPRGDVERQMVHAGPAPVVTAGDPVRRLLKDDVGGTHLPALPLRPLHEGLVTQLGKQPSPSGLGYTSWDYESLAGPGAHLAPGDDLVLRVGVRNTGARPGREVVQAYVSGAPGGSGRPVRVLGGFGSVLAAPGEAAEIAVRVPARVFAVFDEAAGQWAWPAAEFTVQVGRSSRDLRLSATVQSG